MGDVKDLLEFDFSKYNKVAINGVYLEDIELYVKDHPTQVIIFGTIDGKLVMTTHFSKDSRFRVVELKEDYLSIREVRNSDSTTLHSDVD